MVGGRWSEVAASRLGLAMRREARHSGCLDRRVLPNNGIGDRCEASARSHTPDIAPNRSQRYFRYIGNISEIYHELLLERFSVDFGYIPTISAIYREYLREVSEGLLNTRWIYQGYIAV